jgi:CRISPR-associated endoribonuclease Cas6
MTMNMHEAPLYSALLELQALHDAQVPVTMGHQVHAMFLHLVSRADPAYSDRLHNEPGYRPFTLSPLRGGAVQGQHMTLSANQTYQIRVTLLDGGYLWHCLSTLLLEAGPSPVQIGDASLLFMRLLSTPGADPTGWAGRTTWQELSSLPTRPRLTLSFASPTAFNMSGNYFALVPEPPFVWESLLRTWNSYAPASLLMEKQALRDVLSRGIVVTDCDLSTYTLHFPTYTQKGFTGTCTYALQEDNEQMAYLARLAAFARFAGVGYKTTMGMGQVRIQEEEKTSQRSDGPREVGMP